MEHVVRLIEHVKKNFAKGDSTLETFFDIKRAFDTVWHAKLLAKMASLGLSGRLYQFIEAFLNDRLMAVRVGSAISDYRALDMGVPQGSVIALTLFIIMLHDLKAFIQTPRVHMSLFADDLAIWQTFYGKNPDYLDGKLDAYQVIVDAIDDYMEDDGFELSAEKTQAVFFSRCNRLREGIQFRIQGQIINPSQNAKFLGVLLNERLSWQPHVESLITKAQCGVQLVRLFSRERWTTLHSIVNLTRALVRSRLMYSCEVFQNLCQSQWKQLQSIEMTALKAALGLSKGAVNVLTYQEVGWLSLREESRLASACLEARVQATDNDTKEILAEVSSTEEIHSRRVLEGRKSTVGRKVLTLRSSTHELWDKVSAETNNIDPLPSQTAPSWKL